MTMHAQTIKFMSYHHFSNFDFLSSNSKTVAILSGAFPDIYSQVLVFINGSE